MLTENAFSRYRSQKGRSESDCGDAATNFSVTSIGGSLGSQENDNTLPDRHRSLQMPLAPLPVIKKLSSTAKKTHLFMSDEVHDYSEIYTPSAEEAAGGVLGEVARGSSTSMSAEDSSRSFGARTGSGDSGLTGLSGISGATGGLQPEQQPPPPPMHRYPSWEDRIYQVASEGMRDVVVLGAQIDSRNNNNNGDEGVNPTSLRGGFGSDIDVPVYATVKGVSLE